MLTEYPRLELLLDHDNSAGLPGFTLMLRNHGGSQDSLGVTTGFTELLFPDTEVSAAAAARFYLEHIIGGRQRRALPHHRPSLTGEIGAKVRLRQQ